MVRYKEKRVDNRGKIAIAVLIIIAILVCLVLSFIPKIKNITSSYSTEV